MSAPEPNRGLSMAVRWLVDHDEQFAATMREGVILVERMCELYAQIQAAIDAKVAEHPDLAEVNDGLDALYDPPREDS